MHSLRLKPIFLLTVFGGITKRDKSKSVKLCADAKHGISFFHSLL